MHSIYIYICMRSISLALPPDPAPRRVPYYICMYILYVPPLVQAQMLCVQPALRCSARGFVGRRCGVLQLAACASFFFFFFPLFERSMCILRSIFESLLPPPKKKKKKKRMNKHRTDACAHCTGKYLCTNPTCRQWGVPLLPSFPVRVYQERQLWMSPRYPTAAESEAGHDDDDDDDDVANGDVTPDATRVTQQVRGGGGASHIGAGTAWWMGIGRQWAAANPRAVFSMGMDWMFVAARLPPEVHRLCTCMVTIGPSDPPSRRRIFFPSGPEEKKKRKRKEKKNENTDDQM